MDTPTREQQIAALDSDWATNPRWKGVRRTYSAAVRYSNLASKELMVETPSGWRVNPAQEGARKAWALVRQFAGEFGLSPAARSRISAPAQQSPDAADEEFLFGGGLVVVPGGKASAS